MTEQKRTKYRRGLLTELEESGVTQREFAERLGVSLSTLTFWLRKERIERQAHAVGGTELVKVEASLPTQPAAGVFTIEFGEFRIEVPRDTTAEEWKRLREAWTA